MVLNSENASPPDAAGETSEPARSSAAVCGCRARTRLCSLRHRRPATAPPPPKLSAASGVLSFMLIAAVAIFFGLLSGEHRLQEPGPLTNDKVVFIERGGSVFDILSTLESEGVIDSAILVNAVLWTEGKRDSVKAGEYLFHASASMRDVKIRSFPASKSFIRLPSRKA